MAQIEIDNLSFSYHGSDQKSLDSVNLKIEKGEFILLTGRSGCGKTTLTRCINGLIPNFFEGDVSGTVLIDGEDLQHMKSWEIGEKTGSVFQDPRSQFFTTNTLSEVAFGCENLNLPGNVIRERTEEAFRLFDMGMLSNRSIFELSSGEKQKIALASIYAMKPGIFILDEPSANLDIHATLHLAELLKILKAAGFTIIISEHRLYWLMDLVDRIVYMEHGCIADIWTPEEAGNLSPVQLQSRGLRSFSIDDLSVARRDHAASGNVFSVSDMAIRLGGRDILKNVSFSVGQENAGSVIGITGVNGVGKTTLVKLICGLLKHGRGKVFLNGRELKGRRRIRDMYFVMQDPDYQLFTESVDCELRLGNSHVQDLDAKIDRSLSDLGISCYRETHPMALSGGEKQRVTIAAAAVNDASVIFLDEPTSGLDGENMRSVARMIDMLTRKGKLVFIISHDYEFLLSTVDRVIYLENGKVGEDFALDANTVGKLRRLLFDKPV